jgi:SAM-dependent methyltransferase
MMNPYDHLLYVNRLYMQTHPGRMFVQARLAGLEPPPVETCRVLELGASEGANLIGMAVVLPHAHFVGIDLAEVPIERGRRMVADLGQANIDLCVMDLLALEESFGQFDYIVAHGLYAWVPHPVRNKILAIMGQLLTPSGVAFVSYNTYPGAHHRQMLREMMLYHTRAVEQPAEKLQQARALMAVLSTGGTGPDPLVSAIAALATTLLGRTDDALYHDQMASFYEPVYFHEFAAHAARHGLQYVAEASQTDAMPQNWKPEAIEAVRAMAADDRIALEQYIDFLHARCYRQSLLCRQQHKVSTNWDPARLEGCNAASAAREIEDGVFLNSAGMRLTVTHPAPVEFLRRLLAAWPRSEPVSARDAALALDLYRLGMIALHAVPGVAVPPGDQPHMSRLARYQAARGDAEVTTLWHRALRVQDESARRAFALLDGTRSRLQLARELNCPIDQLNRNLDELSRQAVFTA